MRGRIKLVSFDLCRISKNYPAYAKLTENQKLNHICAIINDVSTKLACSDPEAMIIWLWREHGIFSSPATKFVPHSFKKELKSRMLALTRKHPSIVIITGTIVTKKLYTDISLDVLNAILIKDALEYIDDGAIPFEYITKYISKINRIYASINNKLIKDVTIVENTAYLIQGGITQTLQKSVPHREEYEVDQSHSPLGSLFKPGKTKTRNHITVLMHPFTKEVIHIGIEICLEHALGYLRNTLARKRFTKLFLHCVLADSTPIIPEYICADNFLYVDSSSEPQLIFRNKENKMIEHYICHGLETTELGAKMQAIPLNKYLMIGSLILLASKNCNDKKSLTDLANTINDAPWLLQHLTEFGDFKIFKYFLQNKIIPDMYRTNLDKPLIFIAAEIGSLTMVILLCSIQGISLNDTDAAGQTIAHVAAKYGRANILRYLYKNKFNLHSADKNGCTPLMLAERHGYASCVEILLEYVKNNTPSRIVVRNWGSSTTFFSRVNANKPVQADWDCNAPTLKPAFAFAV